MHSISNEAVRPFINFLAILGVKRESCFAALSTTEQAFDKAAQLQVEEYEKLYQYAEHALTDQLIGFHYGQHIDNDRWGVLGQIAFSSETLQQALSFQQKYQSLVGSFGTPIYHLKHGKLILNWLPSTQVSFHIAEEVITGWVALARRLTGQNIKPDYIEFAHSPPKESELFEQYQLFFDCPVFFERTNNGLSVSADVLELPCSRANAVLNSHYLKIADKLLNAASQSDPIKISKQFIRNQLPKGLPKITQLAEHLGLSERSAQRKFGQLNTNFSKLLDSSRQELAKNCLRNTDMSLQEISHYLAFSEQSAFIRAFKRWFGETPAQYRKNTN